MTLYRALLLLFIFALTACDSGVSRSTSTELLDADAGGLLSPASNDLSQITSTTLSGRGTKGPLSGSLVELFPMDGAGYPSGPAIATAVTDDNGDWIIDNVNSTDDLLVKISGGRYTDEADTNETARRQIILEDSDALLSVVPAGENTVAVTLLTHALVEKSRRESIGTDFQAVLQSNRSFFIQAFGFDILSETASDPLNPAGTTEQSAYALVLGGIANAINSLAISMDAPIADYSHILMVANDLVDCRLDSLGVGQQLVVPDTVDSSTRDSLNLQILRFRNNNAGRYEGINLVQVSDAPCFAIGGTSDVQPPQVLSIPGTDAVNAESADGVEVSTELRSLWQAQFAAIDDRSGDLQWDYGIPDQLPLGVNELNAALSDAWGNQITVPWTVVVADLSPPEFSIAVNAVADALGDITAVVLTPPQVSDNVSAVNAISLSNDAPVGGFPVGETLVTWTATDEAGLSSTITSVVLVNSLAPTVSDSVPPAISFTAGLIDFSIYFEDPDATSLTFSLVGLPEGSGLVLDPITGQLTGTPTAVDIAASPITVTVSAFDGQNTVSLTTVLAVQAPNQPPAFSVSQSALTLDEDFGEVVVDVIPAQVPVGEEPQTVIYSIVLSPAASNLVSADIDSNSGQVSLTSIQDAFGSGSMQIVADDGQAQNATFTQEVMVTIAAINDGPEVAAVPDNLIWTTGTAAQFDAQALFVDVDDESLQIQATGLPASMTMSAAGLLQGLPQPVDALADQFAFVLTASDAEAEQASVVLNVSVLDPDTDGDGLSDFEENLLGLDPALIDSDGDGFGDSLEAVLNIDGADRVIFVSPEGDNQLDGATAQSAIRDLNRLSQMIDDVAASTQSFVVLLAATDQMYAGQLSIPGFSGTLQLAGSVDFDELKFSTSASGEPRSTLGTESGYSVELNDCSNCEFHRLRISDGAGGIAAKDSVVGLFNTHLLNLFTLADGAAIALVNSMATIENSHIAGNVSHGLGGALYANDSSSVTFRHTVFSGNYAREGGAIAVVNNSSTHFFNVLATGNGTRKLGIVVLDNASSFTSEYTTFAHNVISETSAGEIITTAGQSIAAVENSVLLFNRDRAGESLMLGAQSGGSNLSSGPAALPGDIVVSEGADFAVSFALGTDLAAGVDSASSTALDAALSTRFSQAGSNLPDTGTAERGFHYAEPQFLSTAFEAQATVSTSLSDQFDSYQVDVYLSSLDEASVTGRRVQAGVVSQSPRALTTGPAARLWDARGLTTLAIDLGMGRYRLWLSQDYSLATDQLAIFIDGSSEALLVQPACALGGCQIDPAVPVVPGPPDLPSGF